jgi:hypothetical protein
VYVLHRQCCTLRNKLPRTAGTNVHMWVQSRDVGCLPFFGHLTSGLAYAPCLTPFALAALPLFWVEAMAKSQRNKATWVVVTDTYDARRCMRWRLQSCVQVCGQDYRALSQLLLVPILSHRRTGVRVRNATEARSSWHAHMLTRARARTYTRVSTYMCSDFTGKRSHNASTCIG